MKFLSTTESAEALKNATEGSDLGSELRVDISGALDRSVALSRLLMSILGKDQPKLLWIREWGVWPSLENWDLFNVLRGASGIDGGLLTDTPGHEFASDELDRSISYLQILLLNGWGGVLIGQENHNRIAISHDSWLSIRQTADLSSQKSLIDDFGLPSRTEKAPEHLLT
ncbi:MAG: hypothetical protein NVSMB18_30630 [Acetobacteraceae bacterium]